jgi:hypothetical protein
VPAAAQVRQTIAKQLLARLPALRAEAALPAPLPPLQDEVHALVATFHPRAATPALPPHTCDLLLVAMLGALAAVRLPALARALALPAPPPPLAAMLRRLEVEPELLACLVGCFGQQ